MTKPVSLGQVLEIIARITTNTGWKSLDGDLLQKNVIEGLSADALGRLMTAFIANNCQLGIKGPSVLMIDRSNIPADLINGSMSIWMGPKEGNGLSGELAQDSRSVTLTEVDFSKVSFHHGLVECQQTILCEEKLLCLEKLLGIRLDYGIGLALFQEKGQVTLRWLHDTFGIKWMEFAGTVLRLLDGSRYFLYLGRRGDGAWGRSVCWLGYDRVRVSVSPLLAA